MYPVGPAVQRKAKEEAERERERKEQEEMCAKKEEWERMQREMSQAAQTTTPAGADLFPPSSYTQEASRPSAGYAVSQMASPPISGALTFVIMHRCMSNAQICASVAHLPTHGALTSRESQAGAAHGDRPRAKAEAGCVWGPGD